MNKESDMTVVEVRRNLSELRKLWRNNSPTDPFHSSMILKSSDLSASEFAFRFVRSHHRNRDATPRKVSN